MQSLAEGSTLSVVIPVFRGETSLQSLITEILEFKEIALLDRHFIIHEIILVNDGSTDNSPAVMAELKKKIRCHQMPDTFKKFWNARGDTRGNF